MTAEEGESPRPVERRCGVSPRSGSATFRLFQALKHPLVKFVAIARVPDDVFAEE